ncbi:tetratricopeptide repeat protein [Dyadobacter sp. 676]|uniref:Tetratricopeptide repeat protein n=1 Tax=Dyadobacter sp. 676 TaxID=3088362 RepID=A0AAU8FM27_9BACT
MKIINTKNIILCIMLAPATLRAQQLITMSNKCFRQVEAGNKQNDQGQYREARDTFTNVLKNCSTKDAKEEGNVGLAIASNGLKQYDSAITAANNAIKASKKTNVMAYYARSYAYSNLGQAENAKADLQKIIELTGKNKDIKARATIFARLAHLDFQLNMLAAADTNLTKAIELDPDNPAFYIQKGDMMVKTGNYDDAFAAYDKALDLGKNDLEIYQIRTEARLKQIQQKYGTTDIKELSGKMTKQEKHTLCADMKKALELGLRNLQLDLLSSMICE